MSLQIITSRHTVNRHSDFQLDMTLAKDGEMYVPGSIVMAFYVDQWSCDGAYIASIIDGVCTNCAVHGSFISVFFNAPGFECGQLKCRVVDMVDNAGFSDGTLDTVTPMSLPVNIVAGAGDKNVISLHGYEPPAGGIPRADLADDVQTSLDKADAAPTMTDVSIEVGRQVGGMQETINAALAAKVDKVTGKGLSTEDYTTAEKQKLGALPTKAELDASLADAGKVKSVTINGTKHTPDAQTGDVNLGTVVGEKGEKGDTGNVVVSDGVAQIGIINDLNTGGTGDALSAEMGKRLGAQVDALEDAVEEMEDGAGYDISIVGQQLVITSRNRPSVAVGEVSNHNVACKAGNTATASFYISGRKLTSAIQIAVSNATNWQVSPTSISPVNGKVALTLVTITYRPVAGTASGTTHNCNVTVTCGGVTYGTIAMQGTVAAAPSITLTPVTLNISTTSGTPATATVNVKGSALEGDIALAISGTGFTLSQNTVTKADAESAAGADVTVTFDGSAAGTATITATATGAATATAEVNGVIPTPLAVGSYWDEPVAAGGYLRYTVTGASTVSVAGGSGAGNRPIGAIVIPSTVNDTGKSTKDSSGNDITPSGMTYNVTSIPANAFSYASGRQMTSVTVPDSVTSIGDSAFSEAELLEEAVIPDCGTIGSYTFNKCRKLRKITIKAAGVGNNAFYNCTQFSGGTDFTPVVIATNPSPSRINESANYQAFPIDSNGKVTADLYCAGVSAYTSAGGWDAFQNIYDINDYTD